MSNPKKVLASSVVLALLIFGGTSIVLAQTAEQIAENALAATVYIEMKDRNGETLGFGSGFFVRENLIATNFHVIEGAARGTAKLVGKYTTYTIEGITATDKTNDLALLKVTTYGIKSLLLGNSDTVKIGATVYVAGNPFGLEGTFSNGIISSRREKDTQEQLQMTAPISPGSSGGPVLNSRGEVIGVSVGGIVGGQNLNFAIPSNYLNGLLTRTKLVQPLAQNPPLVSAETYFKWGNTQYLQKQYNKAIAEYNKAILTKPDYAEAYLNRGSAKADLGQYFAAIEDFNKVLQLKPDYTIAYYNRGVAAAYLGQHAAAISDFDKALQLKPDYAEAYNNRGVSKKNLGKYFDAIADYNQAIRLNPDDASAYNNRGVVRRRLGQYDEAIVDLNKALQLKPDYADAYLNRGNVNGDRGQLFEAIADYDLAIQVNRDYAIAYYNRGVAKSTLGQYNKAITDFDKALEIKPDIADAYYYRGIAIATFGQYPTAVANFDMVIQLEPDYAEAYYYRGIVKIELNNIMPLSLTLTWLFS